MGSNKLFLPFEGESLLRRSVRRAAAAGLSPVVVVLGYEADRAAADLGGLACQLVLNPDHARGMNGSIRTGVAAVPGDAAAVVILLADMPLVTPAMIKSVADRYRESAAPLVAATYGDVAAPPMLYDRSLFSELGDLEGDGCGKRVFKRHRERALTMPLPAEALEDLDEPGDYARLRAQWEGGRP
jgi:molybdenum cofactor cytidylyltransferase